MNKSLVEAKESLGVAIERLKDAREYASRDANWFQIVTIADMLNQLEKPLETLALVIE